MSSETFRHAVSFVGTYLIGSSTEVSTNSSLLVLDSAVLDGIKTAGLDQRATDVIVVEGRPDQKTVAHVADRLASAHVEQLVAVGAGAVLDAAKLALRSHERNGGNLRLVLAPCGPEPYRAVARFAVVDDGQGNRPTVVDARFGTAVVVILPELLARLSDPAIALFSLDTLVHAIESLVSRRANPVSRALAMTAIELIVDENRSRTRVNRVIAACLAAEAFSSTGLGIAHAVASPLGTKAGVSHDGINGVLGRSVVNFWGDSSGFADVCRAFGVGETVEEMTKSLDRFRQAAGLPVSLEEMGITWGSVAEILPRAAQSSGIPWLPRPLQEGELKRFAYQAWSGKGGKP